MEDSLRGSYPGGTLQETKYKRICQILQMEPNQVLPSSIHKLPSTRPCRQHLKSQDYAEIDDGGDPQPVFLPHRPDI